MTVKPEQLSREPSERDSPLAVFLRTLFGIFPYNNDSKYLEIISRNGTFDCFVQAGLADEQRRRYVHIHNCLWQTSLDTAERGWLFLFWPPHSILPVLSWSSFSTVNTKKAHGKPSIAGSWRADSTASAPVNCQPSNMVTICWGCSARRDFTHPLAQDFVHGSTVGDVGLRHHMRPLFFPIDHESIWWPFHILPIAVWLAAAFSLPVGVNIELVGMSQIEKVLHGARSLKKRRNT